MAWPLTPLPVTAELFIGGGIGWTDITDDVRLSSANSGGGISITRGRTAEGSRADPGQASLVLDNRSGRYSPRNLMGDWFGLFGRNTPIRVGVGLAADSFTRTSASGWGSTEGDDPLPWTASMSGVPADFPVAGTFAKHLHPTINVFRGMRLSRNWTDVEQVTPISTPAVATGASIVTGHFARYQLDAGTGDFYWFRLEFDVLGKISVKISKTIAGATTELAVKSSIPGLTYTAGQVWTLRSSVVGNRLALKIWPAGTVEPTAWTLSTVDRSITAPGRAGLASWVVGGNTNVGAEVRFDDYQAINRRAYMEVSEWPPKWDTGGFDRWVPIEAAGILRRLNQGAKPLASAMYRAYGSSNPVDWWPLESGDGRSTESFVSGNGGLPLVASPASAGTHRATGAVSGSVVGPVGAGQAADLSGGGQLTAQVRAVSGLSAWRFEMSVLFTSPVEAAESGQLVRINFANGSLANIFAGTTAGSETALEISGGSFNSYGNPYVLDDGKWHMISLDVASASGGAATTYALAVDDFAVLSGTAPGVPFGAPTKVTISPTGDLDAASHAAFWQSPNLPPIEVTPAGFRGHHGELAADRIERLCAEQGVPVFVSRGSGPSEAMGPQRPATFLDLLRECEDADMGVLFEAREQAALVYRCRGTFYNQTPLTLSYSGGHIAPPFEPVDDDAQLVNDVTVTRRDEGSYRAVRETGPLSVQAPPDGVGVYDASVELNLSTDSQLPDQAGWRRRIGTVDESRYPRIAVDLSSKAWVADRALLAQAAALDSGDLLAVGGLPAWLPAGPIKALIQGYTETLDAFDWDIVWNATPGSVWDVVKVSSGRRVAITGATLAAGITSTATSLSLATTAGQLFTVKPSAFPLDLLIGGERVTVSAITGAVSPQPATVSARSVNGIVRAWPAGTSVNIWAPAVVPL